MVNIKSRLKLDKMDEEEGNEILRNEILAEENYEDEFPDGS